MSQDLFAAFGEVTIPTSSPKTNFGHESSQPATQDTHSIAQDEDEDDEFGDFEDASSPDKQIDVAKANPVHNNGLPFSPADSTPKPTEAAADARTGRHPFADHMDFLFSGGDDEYDAGADDLEDLSKNPEAAMAYSKQLIAARDKEKATAKPLPFSARLNPVAASSFSYEAKDKVQPAKGSTKPSDPAVSVLFDVEDALNNAASEPDEDDFGDFESVTIEQSHTRSAKPPTVEFDLLGLDDSKAPAPVKATPAVTKTRREPASTIRQVTPTPAITATQDDDWDDFETTEPKVNPIQQTASATPKVELLPDSSRREAPSASIILPPTNIPPPAVLLSIFPSIIRSGQETLLDPLSKGNASQRQELLAHPATKILLLKILNVALVLGRIIAGRKLRWKRDQYLAQGMRIGPASSGGRSGMKLAGVDKSELVKEDREVLDAVRVWKAQAGKLKAAATVAAAAASAANAAATTLPPVPEISEQIPVKALKAVEGGLVAPHACALCGLKREERVAKVDFDVNDSFNEWWLEGTSMHVDCLQFWEDHKDKLRSR
jgi:hypothetical protein